MPSQITCASALPDEMDFHSNAVLVHCLNSTSCLTSSIFLTHDSYAAVWLPKSCNQCVQLWAVGGGAMVQEKGSRERCRSWTVLHAQCTSALSSGFPVSQGYAEALERWGEKTKCCLISYFLSNTSDKNYRNRIVCVEIIASQRWHVFWDIV